MTLPASGAISLLDIQNEFGGANPISLNEYYRGGANVPNTTTNAGIPTSGAISVDNFHGTSAAVLVVTTTPTTATVSSLSTGSVTTNSVTASATGNNGAVTYSYAYVSGDSSFTRNGTGATASWTTNVTTLVPDKAAVWRVTGTDAGGNTDTFDINVDAHYTGP